MRRTILNILFLMSVVFHIQAQGLKENVYLRTRTGDTFSFPISSYSKVTFDKENVIIDLEGAQLQYPLADYVCMSFYNHPAAAFAMSRTEETGIDEVHKRNIGINIANGILFANNLPERCTIRIYSLNGRMLYAQTFVQDLATVDLTQFGERILIVQIADKRIKILL